MSNTRTSDLKEEPHLETALCRTISLDFYRYFCLVCETPGLRPVLISSDSSVWLSARNGTFACDGARRQLGSLRTSCVFWNRWLLMALAALRVADSPPVVLLPPYWKPIEPLFVLGLKCNRNGRAAESLWQGWPDVCLLRNMNKRW